jgi:hypothetical protein
MKTPTNKQTIWADKVVALIEYEGREILLTAGGDYKVTYTEYKVAYTETDVSVVIETFTTKRQAMELIDNVLNI